jgi:hypothetical protein
MGKSVSIEEPHPDEQHEAAPALGFIWYLKIFSDEMTKEPSKAFLVFKDIY